MNLIDWCKKHCRLLCLDAVCIVCALVLTGYMNHIIGLQYSQQEAQRWQADGEIKYHQVSAYMQNDSGIGLESISQIRSDIQSKLIEASYAPDSVTGRLWIDAYMAMAKDSASKTSEMGTADVESVNIIGVGGDFFQFHPQDLISGNVFWDDDPAQDKVLIDQETAWQLYGATDIADKTIDIGSRQFVISGVYRANADKTEAQARGNESYIFMDYDLFRELYPEKNLISYEAVMPNPVKGFALLALKEAFGEPEDTLYAEDIVLSFSDKEYVDNTTRFDTVPLLRKLIALPKLMMHTTQVSYPYWENAVRALELKLEFLLLFKILFLLPVLVTIMIVAVVSFRQCKQFVKANFGRWTDAVSRRIEDKARERRRKREKAEEAEETEEIEEEIQICDVELPSQEQQAENEQLQGMLDDAMAQLGDAVGEMVGEVSDEV